MSGHVFLSHSSHDTGTVEKILEYLESRGVRCWIAPRDIPPGSDWAESIMNALAGSETMIMVLSSSSNQSAQVRREVEHAVNAGVSIIPVIVDGTEPSVALRYYISAHQWVDASGGLDEGFLRRLADSLLEEQSEAETAAPEKGGVTCDKRGFSNPSGAKHCVECGGRIGPPVEKSKKSKRTIRIVSIVIAVLVLAFVVRAVVRGAGRKKLYSRAMTALQEDRWQDAHRAFERLGSYRDSPTRAYQALLGGIQSLHQRAAVLEAEQSGNADQEWDHLSKACGTFLEEYPDSTASQDVRLYLADALFALQDYTEAGEAYLELAEEDTDTHRVMRTAVRSCESFIAAYQTGGSTDTSAILQRQLRAVSLLADLEPPPRQLVPLVGRVASNHFQAGMYRTSADLWRRIFLHSPSDPARLEAASRLSECYLLMGDTTEAERWKLLATGELPPQSPEGPVQMADSLLPAEDSSVVVEQPPPTPRVPPQAGPRPDQDQQRPPGGRGGARSGSTPGRD
ncbi:TIR domain-containing protein [Candidatus Fermentibacteria bacterium]|nr:TIR domain-containing protein [Candidatus Fermentibacteria bacterium]